MKDHEICSKCQSTRLASLSAKCSDMCGVNMINTREVKDGYVPSDMGVGGGDYIAFAWCLDCGTMQGTWPLPKTELETPEEVEVVPVQCRNNLCVLDEYHAGACELEPHTR